MVSPSSWQGERIAPKDLKAEADPSVFLYPFDLSLDSYAGLII